MANPKLEWESVGIMHVCPFGALIGEDGKEFWAFPASSKKLIFPPMSLNEAQIKFERIIHRKAKVMLKKLGDEA